MKCQRCGEVNPAEIHTCTPKEQEPVAWVHNFIDGGFTKSRPNDLGRYPNRWTALYKDPTPCQTCEALARTVMMDQTSHDLYTAPPHHEEGCAECGKQASEGWALYCVQCIEPPRTWAGLTEYEVGFLTVFDGLHDVEVPLLANFIRRIEAKLKEKNT